MSFLKEVGEVVKTIARSATVTIGTKKAVNALEKGLPNFSAKSKLIWEKVKSTKSTGKQKVDWIEEAEEDEIPPGFNIAVAKNVPVKKFSPAFESQKVNESSTEPSETDVSSETNNKE